MDYENDNNGQYKVIVRATDPGRLADNILVTVTTTDVNEAPSIAGPMKATNADGPADPFVMGLAELRVNEVRIDENGDPVYSALGAAADDTMNQYSATDQDATGTITWSHRGADANAFNFGASGVGQSPTLTFKETYRPDYEAPKDSNRDNVYHVTLIARDTAGLEDTMDVTVFAVNLTEAYDSDPNADPDPKVVQFSTAAASNRSGAESPGWPTRMVVKMAGRGRAGHIDYVGLPGEPFVGRRRDSPDLAVGQVQECETGPFKGHRRTPLRRPTRQSQEDKGYFPAGYDDLYRLAQHERRRSQHDHP